jgi:hypothetical protein
MISPPHKSKLERAEELEIDAQVEHSRQNHVYADELARSAHHLRMEHHHIEVQKQAQSQKSQI